MTALDIVWGIIRAAMLPAVMLSLVATAKAPWARDLVGFGGLIVLTFTQVGFLIGRMQHEHLPASSFWLGPDAPAFALLALFLAIGIVIERLREGKA